MMGIQIPTKLGWHAESIWVMLGQHTCIEKGSLPYWEPCCKPGEKCSDKDMEYVCKGNLNLLKSLWHRSETTVWVRVFTLTRFSSHSSLNCWNFWDMRSWALPIALLIFPRTTRTDRQTESSDRDWPAVHLLQSVLEEITLHSYIAYT